MIELYKHQIKMINEARTILDRYNLVYISAETRTGKTLATIHLLKDDYNKILVLTKKKALSSWESDLKLSQANNFTVTNYESIHKLDTTDFDIIVLDESHSIGSYPKPSKKARDIKAIAEYKKIVYLSATPSAEAYSQLFHQLWVSSYSPFIDYKSFYSWYREFGNDDSFIFNGRTIAKYKDIRIDEIMPYIQGLMVQMTKEEAEFNVIVNEQLHHVEIDTKYQSLLKNFKRDRIVNIKNSDKTYTIISDTPPSLINKLHQFAGGTIKADDKNSLVVSLHKVEYIENYLSKDRKIVILCNYIKERDLLLNYLCNATDDVDKFKEDDSYKYFIGHIKTYSEGVDFSYADSMIIYSLNFSATTYIQSKERLANKKRVEPIQVNYLLTKNSIDEMVHKAVSNKMNFTASYYKKA